MANPYHDENGKFCSAQDMMNAVLRLQLAGDTEAAVKLMGEYQAATRQERSTTPPPTDPHRTATLADWKRNHAHLRTGTGEVALELNRRWMSWGDDADPNMNSHIRDTIDSLAQKQPAPHPNPDHDLPELALYQSEVLQHYPLTGASREKVETTPERSLAVFSYQNQLFGVVVQESSTPESWTYGESRFFPVAPPREKKVVETRWTPDETLEGQAEAEAAYQRHFPEGFNLSYAAEYSPSEEEAVTVPKPVINFTGRRHLGEELYQAVYLLDGKHYLAEEVVSSWDDGRGILAVTFRPVTQKEENRTILYFPQTGRKKWSLNQASNGITDDF